MKHFVYRIRQRAEIYTITRKDLMYLESLEINVETYAKMESTKTFVGEQ